MKKLIVPILTIIFLSVSSLAIAGKDSGLYVGGSLGSTSLDVVIDTAEEEDVNFDDDDMGWKIYAGYNFGLVPMFDLAVEGSYVDFGGAAMDDLDVDVTAYDVFGLACYNIGPVGIFGKVGYVWWDADLGTIYGNWDKSDSDMAYGIGLKFQFSSLAVRVEYERFEVDVDDFDIDDDVDVDLDFISAGITWTF